MLNIPHISLIQGKYQRCRLNFQDEAYQLVEGVCLDRHSEGTQI